MADGAAPLAESAVRAYRGLVGPGAATTPPQGDSVETLRQTGGSLALASMVDLAIFFAVLLVGFAYVWRRGDLDWVRAVPQGPGETAEAGGRGPAAGPQEN